MYSFCITISKDCFANTLQGCHCPLPTRSIRLRREESPAGFELAKPEAASGGLLQLPEENLIGLDLLSGLSPTQARQVQLRWVNVYLKGQCHEIFCFWFPQAPEYTIRAVAKFFRKFAEIFAVQGAPPVSLTPVANGKNLQS